MKLRYYIIATLAAAAALFTGCKEEGDTYFNEIRVSKSYVGIPMDGGEESAQEMTVTAQGDWAIEIPEDCKWLTVSPMSGGAGETKVTLTATKTLDGRNVEILITCLGKVQHINIIQGLPVITEAKVSEVMEGPEKMYRVTGTVTKIHGAHYGNMYINDGTVEDPGLQIYGSLDKKGNIMNSSTPYDCFNDKNGNENSWDIAVGDKVTVEGPMVIYNTTIELKNVTIINIEKALVKVIPENVELKGPEAGDTLIKIATKAPSIKVKPNDDWLYVKEIEQKKDTVYTRIGFFANEGDATRTGTISVTGEGFRDITITFTQGTAGNFFNATFAEGDEGFTWDDISLPEGSTYVWKYDAANHYLKASSFFSSARHASESIAVSPEIDLTSATKVYLNFSHVGKNFASVDSLPDMVSAEVKADGEWSKLTIPAWFNNTTWDWVDCKDINLSAYAGKKIQIGFRYISTTENCGTWEVKAVKVCNTPSSN